MKKEFFLQFFSCKVFVGLLFFVSVLNALDTEFIINEITASGQSDARSTILKNGNIVVTFRSVGSSQQIRARIFSANGTATPEFPVYAYVASDQQEPTITTLANGDFVIACTVRDGYISTFIRIFSPDGTPRGVEFQLVTNYPGNTNVSPSISGLENGNFVIAWDSSPSNAGIYIQMFSYNGSAIGPNIRITPDLQHNPSVSGIANSNFVVAWTDSHVDGINSGIKVSIFNSSGTTLVDEIVVNNIFICAEQIKPQVSRSGDNFIISWWSFFKDRSDQAIAARIFAGDGTPISDEFLVNTYTAGAQTATLNNGIWNGNFLVTWNSQDQDGAGAGAYAQIFNSRGSRVGNEFRVNIATSSDQFDAFGVQLNDGNLFMTFTGQDVDVGIVGRIISRLSATNTSGNISYTENTPKILNPIIISPPIFITTVSVKLTLSEQLVGELLTGKAGNTTSTFNSFNGTWEVVGEVQDVNTLMSNLTFLPAPFIHQNFSIQVLIDDGFFPLSDTIYVQGIPGMTTSPLTSSALTTARFTTASLTSSPLTTTGPLTSSPLTSSTSPTSLSGTTSPPSSLTTSPLCVCSDQVQSEVFYVIC